MSLNENGDHDRISPTAKITAYWRSLSDIPFSQEIAQAVDAESTARQMLGDRIVSMGTLSPSIFEVRYKSINRGLARTGLTNVLELACGLSPRGLEIAAKGGVYVGTDLPEMLTESASLMTAIAGRDKVPLDNLHFHAANVLDREALEHAAAHFRKERFAICNEGLLMYLNREEKVVTARNIRELLLRNGGHWITTDIVFRALRDSVRTLFSLETRKALAPVLKAFAEKTGRDIHANDFANKAEAVAFFEKEGFSIEEFPVYDRGDILSTSFRLHERFKERFLDILASAKAWILTPR